MENLLKTLLKEKKEVELIRLNAVDIVNSILDELQDRERDVISRRFALGKDDYQTLEEIGRTYNLTRERVRQIERASLKKIKNIDDLDKRLGAVREIVSKLLNEHGGIMEKNFMLDVLTVLTVKIEQNGGSLDRDMYKNYLEFLLSELLDDQIEKVDSSSKFSSFFKLKDQAVDYLENMVDELKEKLVEAKKVLHFEELVDVLKSLKSFSLNRDKIIKRESDLDLRSIFKDDVFPEWAEIINKHKSLYSFMQAIKDINPNKFGFWGSDSWSEIKPKRIADKIFLILKNEKKPMHFTEITKKINETGFDKKKVSSGSVHNELILDDRYILTDRGVYGLKDWSMAN
jgi:hypothetical protein